MFKKLLFTVVFLLFSTLAYANCTGCGKDGHEQCPIEGADHKHEPEVVFAVCVFSDGHLIDHKGADNMSDCLKTKRTIERNMQIDPNKQYENGAQWSCQKLHVEIDEGGNILGFVDGLPKR